MADNSVYDFPSPYQYLDHFFSDLENLINQLQDTRKDLAQQWKLILALDNFKATTLSAIPHAEQIRELKGLLVFIGHDQEYVDQWLKGLNVSKIEELPYEKIIETIDNLKNFKLLK